MNIKALKYTLFYHGGIGSKKNPFIIFFLGVIILLILSYYYSNFFYFLSIPSLLFLLLLLNNNVKIYKEKCKKEEYMSNGSHTVHLENNTKYLVNLLDGQRHGSFIKYYGNGKKSKDCNYEKGELHGEYKEYHENGNLKLQTQYKKGTQTGETKSFYDNGNKYRESNHINGEYEGEIKEYFKNGNLKFVSYNDNYTFYKNNNIACEIEYGNPPKGIWKNHRDDGTIEYELDFDIKYADRVLKTIYTKGGDIYSKKKYGYVINRNAQYVFLSSYSRERQNSESIYIPHRTRLIGPPPSSYGKTVELKTIKSIEDIIELTPIKDPENE